MSEPISEELRQRCQLILDQEDQGVPLVKSDYVLFAVATVIIPVILIAIGVLL
ncbi:hypothetical protein [Mycobacterium dioxanotrophicus]|jgi:hypothetical protein|uniref:hypothetical protein n=1 Tax=Mycobacterium dioxanotrophicus TaxID=482462 RepID=UPI0012FA8D53|nr:hypothetical protein [Mycobacterium dioxanotrophicus]